MKLNKLAAGLAALCFAALSWAAVDANRGSAAELNSLKGVGPTLSSRILEARKAGEFKDWDDLIRRVKGLKEKSATKLSAEGLTVNGQAYTVGAGAAALTATAPKASSKPAKAQPAAASADNKQATAKR